ncbi:rpa-interacting protein a [Plakobranchus ocellatus]|uniref:Rpa-interacting protein a n=1 Tax=Plakobranchus ocellatus TaxID=259542 RepID=A0AAV4AKC1_9GAST|nr:rpa-interacting protein a [Plakobranchus ocellatus]
MSVNRKSCKSGTDVQQERQGMYKMRSPAWKETYRNRCLERLRENRNKCHALRRNLCGQVQGRESDDEEENSVDSRRDGGKGDCGEMPQAMLSIDEIMEQEWNHMTKERKPQAWAAEGDSTYIDSMISLYEDICSEIKREIQNDLEREEKHLLGLQELWETELQYEEDELCSAIESLTTDEVICPLCEKQCLLEHKGVILCKCGLRIDTQQDCISLKNIKNNLQAGTSEHSSQCEAKPEFSLSQKFGITNILMSCQDCDFLFIIV